MIKKFQKHKVLILFFVIGSIIIFSMQYGQIKTLQKERIIQETKILSMNKNIFSLADENNRLNKTNTKIIENNQKLKLFISLDNAINSELNQIETANDESLDQRLQNVNQLLSAYQSFILENKELIEQEKINPTITTDRVVHVLSKVTE